jgi:hypothetical protein
MIGSVQRDLLRISPWMTWLDRFGARTQTEVVRFSIVVARAGAWRFATELASTPDADRRAVIDERDRAVAAVGRRVLHPGIWMSAGLRLVRLRERADVAANLQLLLDAPEPTLGEIERRVAMPTMDG